MFFNTLIFRTRVHHLKLPQSSLLVAVPDPGELLGSNLHVPPPHVSSVLSRVHTSDSSFDHMTQSHGSAE